MRCRLKSYWKYLHIMHHDKLPRRRIQRAFIRWLMASRADWAIPVIVRQRRDRFLECEFHGLTTHIRVTLLNWEIVVEARLDEECWDLLAGFEGLPKRVTQGYVCRLCDPETRPLYRSRDAVWRDEIFEPFRAWVNETLARSDWLAFYQTSTGGSTWARLGTGDNGLAHGGPPLQAVITLRHGSAPNVVAADCD